MKSIKEPNKVSTKIKWDKVQLLKAKNEDVIILTNREQSGSCFFGTIVYSTHKEYPLGYSSTGWWKKDFEIYTGSIKLIN